MSALLINIHQERQQPPACMLIMPSSLSQPLLGQNRKPRSSVDFNLCHHEARRSDATRRLETLLRRF